MVDSKLSPLAFNVPIVDPRTGHPTPYFCELVDRWLKENAVTDGVADAAVTQAELDAVVLNDLADVDTTGVASGDVLSYDGSDWVAAEPSVSFRGALVKKSADQTGANFTAGDVPLTFNTEVYDTNGFHNFSSTVTITIASPGVVTWTAHGFRNGSTIVLTTTGALPTGFTAGTTYFIVNAAANTFQLSATFGGAAINTSGTQSGTHTATNTSVFRIPSGVSRVRLWGHTRVQNSTAADFIITSVKKNGSIVFDGTGRSGATGTSPDATVSTAVIDVVAGDDFELSLFSSGDASVDVIATRTSFSIEVVE
jgi:hypothetical protein